MSLLNERSEINKSRISVTYLYQIICTQATSGALITKHFNESKLLDQFK